MEKKKAVIKPATNRPIILVLKDEFKTTFLQHADMFEDFKFVGKLFEAVQDKTHWKIPLKEIVDRCNTKKTPEFNFTTVGVIIPEEKSYFTPNHKVFSNGQGWMTVEQLCGLYESKLEE